MTPRRSAQGTATARLRGGPADGHLVDLTVTFWAPSPHILAKVFEGAAVAIDQLTPAEAQRQDELAAEGWGRYQWLPHRSPDAPFEYVYVD